MIFVKFSQNFIKFPLKICLILHFIPQLMACMHLTPMKESYSETETKIVEEICLVVVNET